MADWVRFSDKHENGTVGIGTTSPGAQLQVGTGINSAGLGAAPYGTVGTVQTLYGTNILGFNLVGNGSGNYVASTDSAHNGGGAIFGDVSGNLWFATVPTTGGSTQTISSVNLVNDARMVVQYNGNVGIGLTNPTYQLQLSTDSAAKPGTSTWTIASDERLKDIRAPFTRGLDALNGLNTIYFNYKKDNPLGLPSKKEFVGIKAQDALKVIPEAVSTDEQGYLHVTNDSIIWTAVNAIKELYGKFLGHDREIASIKAENSAKDQEIAQLKSRADKAEANAEKLKAYLCAKDPKAPICK